MGRKRRNRGRPRAGSDIAAYAQVYIDTSDDQQEELEFEIPVDSRDFLGTLIVCDEEVKEEQKSLSGSSNSDIEESNGTFFAVKGNTFSILGDGPSRKQHGKKAGKCNSRFLQESPSVLILSKQARDSPNETVTKLTKSSEKSYEIERLRSELASLQDKFKQKQEKVRKLKADNLAYKKQHDSSQNHIQQLKAIQNQAKSLTDHNFKLKQKLKTLEKQSEAVSELRATNSSLLAQMNQKETELSKILGRQLDSMELGECIELLTTVSESLRKIQQHVRVKSDTLLALCKCVICMTSDRSVVLKPCGHFSMCEKCSRDLKTCPLCRCSISDKIKVHMS